MSWSKKEIVKVLMGFVCNELGVDDPDFGPSSDLFEDGYVDSIHLERFFSFIEETFGIVLEEDNFFDPRIATLEGLSDLVLEAGPKTAPSA